MELRGRGGPLLRNFLIGNLSQSLKYALTAVGNLRFPMCVIAVNGSDMED